MKLHRFLLSTVIVPASIITLVACSSDDDSDNNTDNGAVDNTPSDVLLFDEGTDGDIVNDPNNPQPLQFIAGANRINAQVVSPDLDYITVNVPAGSQLTSIELTNFTSVDDQSFIAVQAGSVFTELADSPAVENLLGYAHFGVDMLGTDILPALGEGQGSQGFAPPLEAGDYTFWMQETGDEPVNFSLNFVVEPAQ